MTGDRVRITVLLVSLSLVACSNAPPPAGVEPPESPPERETGQGGATREPEPEETGDREETRETASRESVLPEPADDPGRAFAEGLTAADAGDHGAALGLLERAVVAEPENLRYSAEYRQVAIAAATYDRSIRFFEALAEEYPDSAAVFLSWGYAYVDKIPAAGAVTQVILANTALKHFTEALEREVTWLGLYTRGNSYIYWPAIFNRTAPGIADLERAIELAEDLEPRPYRARAWVALGDGYWRLDDLERAREIWRRGLRRYPGHPDLEARLAREDDDELDRFLRSEYEIGKRVETHLRELWSEEDPE